MTRFWLLNSVLPLRGNLPQKTSHTHFLQSFVVGRAGERGRRKREKENEGLEVGVRGEGVGGRSRHTPNSQWI